MIVVVTAAIGTTETPPSPPFVTSDIRYVCATDREDVPGWERWPAAAATPRRHARDAKMQAVAQFDGDIVVWADASFDWLQSPGALVDAATAIGVDVAGFAHPDRHRIRDEAQEVKRLGLAPVADVAAQIAAYHAIGFDTDRDPQRRLTTTGLLVFFPSPSLRRFLDLWQEQVAVHTVRDQLSIDYCAWRTEARIGHLPGHYRDNAFVFYNRERHRARRSS